MTVVDVPLRGGAGSFPWLPNSLRILVVDTVMKTRIQKGGNSLAVRIPKALAEEAHLAENVAVDVTVRNGKLRRSFFRRNR